MKLISPLRTEMKFSQMFLDFCEEKEFFNDRFPMNKSIFSSSNTLEKISYGNVKRTKFIEVIEKSFGNLSLSKKQRENLEILTEPNSLNIITGQQVGFLGGPIYSVLKLQTAVSMADILNKKHNALAFVPIFWVEDNDHDNFEASFIHIFNEKYEPVSLSCSIENDKNDLRTVSSRVFDKDIISIIKTIKEILPALIYKQDLCKIIEEIYQPGKNWSDAFIEFLQIIFAESGILFCKSSELRKAGLFRDIIRMELENPGKSKLLIDKSNDLIQNRGYHIQAKSRQLNLFYINNDKRHKIEALNNQTNTLIIDKKQYSQKELLTIFDNEPSSFSPNVMLRSLCQDSIFPTAAYIGGPAEIAYLTQLKEVYNFFDILQPARISRISATFIDKKTINILNDEGLEADFFFINLQELQSKLKSIMLTDLDSNTFDSAFVAIEAAFQKINEYVLDIDKNLENSVTGEKTKILKRMEFLRNKVARHRKKSNLDKFDRLLMASNLIFPKNTLQERFYSPLNFINSMGLDAFKNMMAQQSVSFPMEHRILEL